MTGFATAEPGAELPGFTARLTRADLAAYAEASGDHNPIHLDEVAARAAGLPGVVAHGMATLALAARLATGWAGPDARVSELRTRFSRPVVVPADGTAEVVLGGRVASVEPDGTVRLDLTATADGAAVLLQARATLVPAAGARAAGPGAPDRSAADSAGTAGPAA